MTQVKLKLALTIAFFFLSASWAPKAHAVVQEEEDSASDEFDPEYKPDLDAGEEGLSDEETTVAIRIPEKKYVSPSEAKMEYALSNYYKRLKEAPSSDFDRVKAQLERESLDPMMMSIAKEKNGELDATLKKYGIKQKSISDREFEEIASRKEDPIDDIGLNEAPGRGPASSKAPEVKVTPARRQGISRDSVTIDGSNTPKFIEFPGASQ